jgi:sporulation protein YlmC with PRC-barrel domain
MKKTLLIAALSLSGLLAATGAANAQIAGSSTTLGVMIAELNEVVATGWSAKKSLMGKAVYNDSGAKIGTVEDLIVAPDRKVSYLILGVGGFIGMGRHDVAIPASQIQEQGGKLVLAGGTKDALKAMPKFDYASDTAKRDQFIARADADVAAAKVEVADLEKRASMATAEAKVKLDAQRVAVQNDMKLAEDKLSEMKKATVKEWRKFENGVSSAVARLRVSVEKAIG